MANNGCHETWSYKVEKLADGNGPPILIYNGAYQRPTQGHKLGHQMGGITSEQPPAKYEPYKAHA